MICRHWSLGFVLLLGGSIASLAASPAPTKGMVDFARAEQREAWLHHPAVGDPSWDTFVREPGNPIYTGKEPYLWPVNGFLFRDPPSGRWYAYVGLYPRGYFPIRGGGCIVLVEKPHGGWEELGWALKGDPAMFDGDGHERGGTCDVSIVYADGRYHMIYDWCDPQNIRGGLGYAWSDKPEGPFHRAAEPVHDDRTQPMIAGHARRDPARHLGPHPLRLPGCHTVRALPERNHA
jgi:hypothetical protein